MLSQDEIKALKEKVEEKYRNIFKELEAKRKQELEAIDIVYSLLQRPTTQRQQAPVSSSSDSALEQTAKPKYGVASIVREAIRNIGMHFDLNSIVKFVGHTNPSVKVTRGNFHAAVRKMLKDGEVELVQEGRGKRAAVYKFVGENRDNKDDNVTYNRGDTQKTGTNPLF